MLTQYPVTGTFASAEGCLNILPVWLDHIFNPPPVSVMANAFKNEVHHIAADGSDGGVVWSGGCHCSALSVPSLHT